MEQAVGNRRPFRKTSARAPSATMGRGGHDISWMDAGGLHWKRCHLPGLSAMPAFDPASQLSMLREITGRLAAGQRLEDVLTTITQRARRAGGSPQRRHLALPLRRRVRALPWPPGDRSAERPPAAPRRPLHQPAGDRLRAPAHASAERGVRGPVEPRPPADLAQRSARARAVGFGRYGRGLEPSNRPRSGRRPPRQEGIHAGALFPAVRGRRSDRVHVPA